jgi:Domain of unknown function (4846)
MIAGLGLLTSCQQSASAESDYGALGQSISEKNPHLPTTFVDTTGSKYAWAKMYNPVQALSSRIAPPAGYGRKALPEGSFGEWLRGLPLKPGKPQVLLFNGQPKANQTAQFAVLNIDVGNRDLQQCADAVMRLRAEYLFSQGQHEAIHFNFTNGAPCPWTQWKAGNRPVIAGPKVNWVKKAEPSATHATFRAYMDMVFTYAGTASLEKELSKIGTLKDLQIGDVLIHGGFPGHAVLVLDVAENDKGQRKYLLAQSYMPAQEVHILINPADPDGGPWYDTAASDPIETPEWTFTQAELRRFGK